MGVDEEDAAVELGAEGTRGYLEEVLESAGRRGEMATQRGTTGGQCGRLLQAVEGGGAVEEATQEGGDARRAGGGAAAKDTES
jgi:hypothetical protein